MFATIAIAILLASSAQNGTKPSEPDEVTWSAPDDPAMNAARAEAVRRLPEFFRALAAPGPGDNTFMLKFDLNRGEGDPEFIWADDVRVAGDQISRTLANNPINRNFALGQRVVIRRADIGDWGFFRNGVMQGNFTTRVQLSQMPREQAQAIRENMGW
jgi:uncharacterized protein YegJ (DUF2314 family)